MELHPVKQLDERLAFGRRHGGRFAQFHQRGAPFQRVVGRLLAAEAVELDAPVEVGAFDLVGRMVEFGPAGGAEHARAARLGPLHHRIQQRPQGFRREGLEVVEDDERGRLPEQRGGGGGVQQGLIEDLADFIFGHGHGIGGLHAGVIHEHGGLEKVGAGEPAAGFLGEGGFALAAKTGEGDAPGGAGEPALEVPETEPAPKEAGFGRFGEVRSGCRSRGNEALTFPGGGGRWSLLTSAATRRKEQRGVRALLVEGGEEPVVELELHALRAASSSAQPSQTAALAISDGSVQCMMAGRE